MSHNKKQSIGPFTARNHGNISACYSLLTSATAGKRLESVFVSENKGHIQDCYAVGSGKTLRFAGIESNAVQNCVVFSKKRIGRVEKNGSLEKWQPLGPEHEIRDIWSYDEAIWEVGNRKSPLRFRTDQWFVDTKEAIPQDSAASKEIYISSEQELLEFTKQVNEGDTEICHAHVLLTQDVRVKAKEWVPIGASPQHAFRGTFDGNGFEISGITIHSNRFSYKGFFGVLLGHVYNLTVKCNISGAGVIGGIAAMNKGTISCCGCWTRLHSKGADCAGGLVGINQGIIERCYTTGTIGGVGIAGILLPVILLLLIALLAWKLFTPEKDPVFKPIPIDENEERIDEEEAVSASSESADRADGLDLPNHARYTLSATITAHLDTNTCEINLENPSESNHYMMATVLLPEENSENQAVIAESEGIRPGYKLREISLKDGMASALQAGQKYQAVVHLDFYSQDDYSLAFLSSDINVTLEVAS